MPYINSYFTESEQRAIKMLPEGWIRKTVQKALPGALRFAGLTVSGWNGARKRKLTLRERLRGYTWGV